MKYLLFLFALFLCACGEVCVIKSDSKVLDIEWSNGSCRGVVEAVAVHHSEWTHAGTQFIARCDDGRIIYNLSNYIIK